MGCAVRSGPARTGSGTPRAASRRPARTRPSGRRRPAPWPRPRRPCAEPPPTAAPACFTVAPNSVFNRSTATSNCIGPTPASTGTGSWLYSRRRTWTTPSWSSCSSPRRNCLWRVHVTVGDGHERLGRQRRDRREAHRRAEVQRVPHAHVAADDHTHDVPGERLVDPGAILPEHLVREAQRECPPGTRVRHPHAALKPAGADPYERDAVTVARVHVGLHLEHERGERLVHRPQRAVVDRPRLRGRRKLAQHVQQQPDAEVPRRGAEQHRDHLAGCERLGVELVGELAHEPSSSSATAQVSSPPTRRPRGPSPSPAPSRCHRSRA